jgi:hypothetical protein
MKKVIRLTESDLHNIIKETASKLCNIVMEDSYRKAAKNGDHTSSLNKKELNYKKTEGYKNASRDFHKFAKKHNLDKMKGGASAICRWEDGCNDDGEYVANNQDTFNHHNSSYKKKNESINNLHNIIEESVKNILSELDCNDGIESVKQPKKTKDSHKENVRKIFGNQTFYLIKSDNRNVGVTNNIDFAYELANVFDIFETEIEKINFDVAYDIAQKDELVIRRFYK